MAIAQTPLQIKTFVFEVTLEIFTDVSMKKFGLTGQI